MPLGTRSILDCGGPARSLAGKAATQWGEASCVGAAETEGGFDMSVIIDAHAHRFEKGFRPRWNSEHNAALLSRRLGISLDEARSREPLRWDATGDATVADLDTAGIDIMVFLGLDYGLAKLVE